jgi:hypothetical protein
MGQRTKSDPTADRIWSVVGAVFRRATSFFSSRTRPRQRASASPPRWIPPRDDAHEKAILSEAKAYYNAHRNELIGKFGENCFLAIRSEEIVDFDGDFAEIARKISSKFPGQAVYVVNTADEPHQRILHVDSPRSLSQL